MDPLSSLSHVVVQETSTPPPTSPTTTTTTGLTSPTTTASTSPTTTTTTSLTSPTTTASTSSTTTTTTTTTSSVLPFQTIQTEASDTSRNADLSTQELLRKFINSMKKTPRALPNSLKIKSKFQADPQGKVVVEPYPLKIDGKEKIFYKVQAKYTLEMTVNGSIEKVELNRPIYTTATTPELAILAASQYKAMVTDLAKDPLDTSTSYTNSKVDGYDSLSVDKKRLIQKERSFRFHFSYDTDGKPKKVDYVQADLPNQPQPIKLNWNPKPKRPSSSSSLPKEYKRDLSSFELKRLDPIPNRSIREFIYSSKEEALFDTPYVIKMEGNTAYEYVSKHSERIGEIAEKIKEKEKEFEEILEKFKQKAFFFSKDKQETQAYRELQASVKALEILKLDEAGVASGTLNDLYKLSREKAELVEHYRTVKAQLMAQKAAHPNLEADLINLPYYKNNRAGNPLSNKEIQNLQRIAGEYHHPVHLDTNSTPDQIQALIDLVTTQKTEIAQKEARLKQIKATIPQEQDEFKKDFLKLTKIHEDIQHLLSELESIKQGAEAKATNSGTQPEELTKATEIKKQVGQPLLVSAEKSTKRKAFIDELRAKLGFATTAVTASGHLPVPSAAPASTPAPAPAPASTPPKPAAATPPTSS